MRYLKQTTTGHIYVWTENLATRPDMQEYTPAPASTEQENPSENLENTSAEVPEPSIEDAKAAFRRQVKKGFVKPKQTSGAS